MLARSFSRIWFRRSLCLTAFAAGGAAAQNPFTQAPLPYAENALEPYMSARTLSFHYGKHHKAYVDKANELVQAQPDLAGKAAVDIIRASAPRPELAGLFNQAAQAWNHGFFWACMKADGGGKPAGDLAARMDKDLGGYDGFRKKFVDAALAQFGSGWVWLVLDGDTLKVVKTANADTPLAHGQIPLLVVDVWEHAYYLDYQNRRKDFVEAFLDHLVNWDFVAAQLRAR